MKTLKTAQITNEEVIRRHENAYSPVGGLSVLFGNIAPDGGVIKVGAVDPSIKEFTEEKQSCLNHRKHTQEDIDNGTVKEGRCCCYSLRRSERWTGNAGNACTDCQQLQDVGWQRK